MMRTIALLLAILAVASAFAFAPPMFGVRNAETACYAKHAQDKAAKWAKAKRPRKSRPSDINRKPTNYAVHSMQKPPEYTISDAPAEPLPKPEKPM